MDGNEFGGHAIAVCGNTSAVDNKAFNNLLSNVSCPSSDLSVFENNENKISGDLLYYDWPEIEDVDRMLRSCEPMYGLGVSKEDELSWLSLAEDLDLGGAVDALNPNTKIPCSDPDIAVHMPGNHSSIRGCSMNNSMGSAPISTKDNSWTLENAGYDRSFVTGPAVVDKSIGFNINALEQTNLQKKRNKPQSRPNGDGKGYNVQNGSLKCSKGLPSEVMQLSNLSYNQAFPYADMQHFPQCPKLYSHVQNHISNVHSDNSGLSDLASMDMKPSTAKSNTNGLSPLFCAPGQPHSVQSSNENPTLKISEQWNNLQSCQGNGSSVNSSVGNGVATTFDPVFEAVSATPEVIGSLNMPKSSTMSSEKDDPSLEVASFQQLQLVMKQLDPQTKLCIRDGLYRLARNATNRSVRCGSRPDESESFADMETDTNPIDRSIAHLLFHQVSDSSTAPSRDMFPTMVCSE